MVTTLADRSDDRARNTQDTTDALDRALRSQAAQILFALSYSWPMTSSAGMFVRHVASLLDTMSADAAILQAEKDLRAIAETVQEVGLR